MEHLYNIQLDDHTIAKLWYDMDPQNPRQDGYYDSTLILPSGGDVNASTQEEAMAAIVDSLIDWPDTPPQKLQSAAVLHITHDEYEERENYDFNDTQTIVDILMSYQDYDTILEYVDAVSTLLPVYRYQHSGVAYQTHPFQCPWDSGQVGYIFHPQPDREALLESEVHCYSCYANGDVYGVTIEEVKTCEECGHSEYVEQDACWGFIVDEDLMYNWKDLLPYLLNAMGHNTPKEDN